MAEPKATGVQLSERGRGRITTMSSSSSFATNYCSHEWDSNPKSTYYHDKLYIYCVIRLRNVSFTQSCFICLTPCGALAFKPVIQNKVSHRTTEANTFYICIYYIIIILLQILLTIPATTGLPSAEPSGLPYYYYLTFVLLSPLHELSTLCE